MIVNAFGCLLQYEGKLAGHVLQYEDKLAGHVTDLMHSVAVARISAADKYMHTHACTTR